MKLILASKSPRRKEILENLNVPFTILTADADESCSLTDPHAFVREVSARKALAVKEALAQDGYDLSDRILLSCDTVVACEGQILGKPRDRDDAYHMIASLSGKRHSVISGITLMQGDQTVSDWEETFVYMDPIDGKTIDAYVLSDEPYDKAGGYAIQGTASLWISGIEGCYFNVVGLPVHKLQHMLQAHFALSLSDFLSE